MSPSSAHTLSRHAHCPIGCGVLLVAQLDNPGLFKACWYGADGHSAGLAIASAMPWLIEAERARAEAAILALRPEIACAKRALARAESDTDEPQPPYRNPSSAR